MTNQQSRLEEYEAQLSHHPQDYFGIINDLMDEGFSSGMFGIHRDSEQLEISNYETAKSYLATDEYLGGWDTDAEGNDFYDGDVSIETSSHWAVGWTETIHVRMRDKDRNFTEAFKTACDLLDRLEEYPVLDEEDYSRREHEELYEYLENEVDEEDVDKLARHLFDVHSVSRVEDIHYKWIEAWKEEHYAESE